MCADFWSGLLARAVHVNSHFCMCGGSNSRTMLGFSVSMHLHLLLSNRSIFHGMGSVTRSALWAHVCMNLILPGLVVLVLCVVSGVQLSLS